MDLAGLYGLHRTVISSLNLAAIFEPKLAVWKQRLEQCGNLPRGSNVVPFWL